MRDNIDDDDDDDSDSIIVTDSDRITEM